MHVNLVSKLVSYRCKVLALAEGYRKSLNRRPAVSLKLLQVKPPPCDTKGRESVLLPNVSRTPGHGGSLSSRPVPDTAHLRLDIVQGVCAPLAHSRRALSSASIRGPVGRLWPLSCPLRSSPLSWPGALSLVLAMLAVLGFWRSARQTFASASLGCGPLAMGCMSGRVDRSCNPVDPRSLRLQSMIRTRCPHSYLMLKSTVLHQTSIRFQAAQVVILIAGYRLMCCGHGEVGILAGVSCLVH